MMQTCELNWCHQCEIDGDTMTQHKGCSTSSTSRTAGIPGTWAPLHWAPHLGTPQVRILPCRHHARVIVNKIAFIAKYVKTVLASFAKVTENFVYILPLRLCPQLGPPPVLFVHVSYKLAKVPIRCRISMISIWFCNWSNHTHQQFFWQVKFEAIQWQQVKFKLCRIREMEVGCRTN